MSWGTSTWIDTIAERLETAIANETKLSREHVFLSLTSPRDLSRHPVADQFVSISPAIYSVDAGLTMGAGRPHFATAATWTVSVFARVSSDKEFRATQLVRGRTIGLGKLLLSVLKAIHLAELRGTDNNSALREPCRVTGFRFGNRDPETGCAWVDVTLDLKSRVDLTV